MVSPLGFCFDTALLGVKQSWKTHYTLCLRSGYVYNVASGSKKKKKITKAKFKRIASQNGKNRQKGREKSRVHKKFSLPAKWSENHTKADGNK